MLRIPGDAVGLVSLKVALRWTLGPLGACFEMGRQTGEAGGIGDAT